MPLSDSLVPAVAALGRTSLDVLWLPAFAWGVAVACVLAAESVLPLRRPRLRAGLLAAALVALPLALVIRSIGLPDSDAAERLGSERLAAPILTLPEWTVDATSADPDSGANGGASSGGVLWLWLASGLGAGLAGGVAAIGAVRFARARGTLGALLDRSTEAPRGLQGRADSLADRMGVEAPVVRLYDGPVPVAHARRGRATVYLPRTFEDDAIDLALAHELAHIAHGDLRSLPVERLLGALFAWHPGVAALTRRLDLRREQACDAAVVAACPSERRAYADLLVRVATRTSGSGAAAWTLAAMAVRPSSLRRRVTALTAPLSTRFGAAGRLAALLAAASLVWTAAVPLAAPTGSAVPSGRTDAPFLLNRAELDAQTAQRIPQIARQAGMSGTVEVRVTLTAAGIVRDAAIQRSDNDLFNEPALVVARMARYAVPVDESAQATLALRFDALAPPPPPAPPAPPYESLAAPDGAPEAFVTVDRQPIPLTQVAPAYPEAARRDSVDARVTLRAWVTASGRVQAVRVLRVSDPARRNEAVAAGSTPHDTAFAEAARAALLQWTFEPAMKDGAPVDVWVTIPVRFRAGSAPAATSPPTTEPVPLTPATASAPRCFTGSVTFPLDSGDALLMNGRPVQPADAPALDCLLASTREGVARYEQIRDRNPSDRGFDGLIASQRRTIAALEAALARLR